MYDSTWNEALRSAMGKYMRLKQRLSGSAPAFLTPQRKTAELAEQRCTDACWGEACRKVPIFFKSYV
jgi:hypothetical protein